MDRCRRAAVVSLVAVAALLGLLVWGASRERAALVRQIDLETQAVAQQLANQSWAGLKSHLLAVQQTAHLLTRVPRLTETEFHAAAAPALRLNRQCLRMAYADPSLRVRWVHPLQDNLALVGADLAANTRAQESLQRAARAREPALSPPLSLLDGSQGFIVAAPVFDGERLLGFLTGAFRTADFITGAVSTEFLDRYDIAVSGAGAPLFETAGMASPSGPWSTFKEGFEIGGSSWTLEVRPSASAAQAVTRAGHGFHSAVALLLALAVAASAYALRRGPPARAASADETTPLRVSPPVATLSSETLHEALQAEKLTALGDLVAGVANEINNPLCSILGYTQLLLADEPAPKPRARLESMRVDAERISAIVANLLTFARQQPSTRRPLGLNGIIEKTIDMRAYDLRARQIQIEKDLAPDLPMTLLDFHQVQQLLLSLLANAEQALAESGRRGTIRITTRASADAIELRVADDGPGIPEPIQGRIFEPFFTTRTDGQGTGLGLALCYGIVQDHGGRIRVESRPGQGATFVIALPIVQKQDAPQALQAGPDAAALERRLRILVIDREPSVQDMLMEMLSARGHSVDTAATGPEALRKIGAASYDLILADMKMPNAPARELYAAVVERAPILAGRILFTSGDGMSAQALEFLRDTGNDVLLKPFKMEDVEKALAAAVRG
jgi:signal transduction histidine kinase/ActR/RegA family two-component response regulator